MSTRPVWMLAVLGGAACPLALFLACSSEPHTAKAPLVEIDVSALQGGQPKNRQPEAQCPPCTAVACPEPAVSTARAPVSCSTDVDCSSRFCDRGVCGALRTGNLENGSACRADDHCKSGLCDRGVCTRIGDGLGESCEPLPPFKQRLSRLEDPCGAYLCLDGACRSCTSDSECIYWKGGGTCNDVPGLPGKRCGRLMPLDPDGPYRTPPPLPLGPIRLPSGAVHPPLPDDSGDAGPGVPRLFPVPRPTQPPARVP